MVKRLEKILPYAFVKERTISDAVRIISNIMDYMEMKGYEGMMYLRNQLMQKAYNITTLYSLGRFCNKSISNKRPRRNNEL